jgi:hypothetical protein
MADPRIWRRLIRQILRPLRWSKISRDGLHKFLDDLLGQGAHGARLVIRPDGSQVQFKIAKTLEPSGERLLQLVVPDLATSEAFYLPVKKALSERGVRFTEQRSDEPGIRRLLYVTNLRDVDSAINAAMIAFGAAGLAPEQTFTVNYEGGVSMEEWKRTMRQMRGPQ